MSNSTNGDASREAMLAGVSAGVIGIDPDFTHLIVNRSALNLLGMAENDVLGKTLARSGSCIRCRLLDQALHAHPAWLKARLKCQRQGQGCKCSSCASPLNDPTMPNMAMF